MLQLDPLAADALGAEVGQPKGSPPQLQWIEIAALRVDPTYQRDIKRAGRRNMIEIARGFDWSKFVPVIVSPIEGGHYAIIDGQHRATAALSIGIKSVPCQIILATQAEQAAAFSAINGNTTRIGALQIHKAAVAAGDAEALTIERIAMSAGVKILRYPKRELDQEPGETMAIETIRTGLKTYGETLVALALQALNSGQNRVRGGLGSPIVRAIIDFTADARNAGGSAEQVRQFIGERLMIREMDKAQSGGLGPGISRAGALKTRLMKQWHQWIDAPRR